MKNILSLLLIISGLQALANADTTRYTILTTEKISGKQLMWSDGPGKVSYFYEFNDRGRGPRVRVDISHNNDQITYRKVWGVDYYKGPVLETFELTAGTAKWKNKTEDDQRNVTGPVIYSPMEGVPGEIEWNLKLIFQQHSHEVDILPAGKMKATHVKSHTARVNGFPEELELYAFTGLGGPPFYAWVTPKKDFFAQVGGWMSTIKLGYEFLVPELKKLQEDVSEDYFEEQAYKHTQKSAGPVAIEHVNLFDAKSGKMLADHTVVFENGKITAVGKSSKVKAPANSKIISGQGKSLFPGLWDNHSHYSKEQGLYHLAGGVTNIKDMANSLDLPAIMKRVDADELMGPEVSIMSGFIDFAGPYAGPTGKIVKTLDEGIAAVNYYADKGYQQIKLYSSIPPDWVKPLSAEAHKRGLKVCGHIPSFMTAERAVNDGYDQIIHMNMIMLNFLGDSLDTRSMGRFIKVAERARNIDLNSTAVKNFIQLLKQKHIVVDPTLAIFEEMFTNEPGKLAAGYESVQGMFPAEFKRGLYVGGLPTMKGHESEYKQSFEKMMGMLKLFQANGITFVPGTDGLPGFTLHRELELYAKAGVPNSEVLQKATLVSARVAGKDTEFGSIEPGKVASMVLINGDPVKNISDIRKVDITIKRGNIYNAKELYSSYGFNRGL